MFYQYHITEHPYDLECHLLDQHSARSGTANAGAPVSHNCTVLPYSSTNIFPPARNDCERIEDCPALTVSRYTPLSPIPLFGLQTRAITLSRDSATIRLVLSGRRFHFSGLTCNGAESGMNNTVVKFSPSRSSGITRRSRFLYTQLKSFRL